MRLSQRVEGSPGMNTYRAGRDNVAAFVFGGRSGMLVAAPNPAARAKISLAGAMHGRVSTGRSCQRVSYRDRLMGTATPPVRYH